jgi:polyphosphate glucokinase
VRVLVVDVGGNNVKVLASGQSAVRKVPSGPDYTPSRMVAAVRKAIQGWRYDVVSIGYPGPVRGAGSGTTTPAASGSPCA